MKESMKIKLLLAGLIIVLMTACAVAQPGFDTNTNKTRRELKQLSQKTIKIDLSITIDNKLIEDTSYVLNIVNYNTGIETQAKVSNKFILFLDYNTEFEVSMSYKGTNMKTIIVNTKAPEDENWYIITGIDLSTKNNNRILAGSLKYDDKTQSFKKYK
jgi:hypothetical protein